MAMMKYILEMIQKNTYALVRSKKTGIIKLSKPHYNANFTNIKNIIRTLPKWLS